MTITGHAIKIKSLVYQSLVYIIPLLLPPSFTLSNWASAVVQVATSQPLSQSKSITWFFIQII